MIIRDKNLKVKGIKNSKHYKESKILVDKKLYNIKDYLGNLNLNNYPGNFEVKPYEIIDKNREFFDKYLPLQKILVSSVDGLPHEADPFEIVNISNTSIEVSNACPFIVANIFGKNIYGYGYISVTGDITKLSYGTLAHEITHTQANNINKTTNNFYNLEMLPIFIEFLMSEYIGEDVLYNKFRKSFKNVHYFLDNLPGDNVILYRPTEEIYGLDRSYISSYLKALHLYDIYNNASIEDKKQILLLIEDIFKKELTTEKFLRKMGVTYNNSKDLELVKKYIK